MKNEITNILIGGVGGQGILLASEVLSDVALAAGLDVRKSEVHGMAQRGGSVVSHVRFGAKVFSSLIQKGEADILLAFEKLEALRWLPYLKPAGKCLVNTMEIVPMSVTFGDAKYPADIVERIEAKAEAPLFVNGMDEAQKLGNPRCANVILLGILSKSLDFDEEAWKMSLKKRIKPKYHELNMKAFARGCSLA